MSGAVSLRPLDGIKVVDLTRFIAGPICTQYLGDLGADVVKIEDPVSGDDTRGVPPFHGEDGIVFLANNRNKRSVRLDLKTEAGIEAVRRLIARSDVLVESFGTGVAERLGFGVEQVRAANPQLIYCSISAFGRSGPLGQRPGYELMMQAFSGMMTTTGEPGGGPLRIGFSPLDQTTGIHGLTGVLAALRLRDRTGQGSYVEASLFETAMAFLGWHAQQYWCNGELPQRYGSGSGTSSPYQAFRTTDGYILLAVGSDRLWAKFCRVIGMPERAEDPRFATNAARVERGQETIDLVQGVIGTRGTEEWLALFVAEGIPASPVNSLDTVLSFPQLAERDMILACDHAVAGPLKFIAHPVHIHGTDRAVRRPPPRYGEHTMEVLQELGFSDEEIGRIA